MADKIKLSIAGIIMVCAIVLFYSYSETSTLIRVLGLVAAAGVSLFVVSKTASGARTLAYFGETQTEVRKVVWPTRQETVQTTLLVVVMVIIVALMLWGFDSLLGWIVRQFTA